MVSTRFQLGEGPSKGLLRDYEPLDEPSLEALDTTAQHVLSGL